MRALSVLTLFFILTIFAGNLQAGFLGDNEKFKCCYNRKGYNGDQSCKKSFDKLTTKKQDFTSISDTEKKCRFYTGYRMVFQLKYCVLTGDAKKADSKCPYKSRVLGLLGDVIYKSRGTRCCSYKKGYKWCGKDFGGLYTSKVNKYTSPNKACKKDGLNAFITKKTRVGTVPESNYKCCAPYKRDSGKSNYCYKKYNVVSASLNKFQSIPISYKKCGTTMAFIHSNGQVFVHPSLKMVQSFVKSGVATGRSIWQKFKSFVGWQGPRRKRESRSISSEVGEEEENSVISH